MPHLQPTHEAVTADVTLRDGASAQVRALGDSDSAALERFIAGLSEETIYYRFLTTGISRESLVGELSPRRGCLVLVAMFEEKIVGLASYCRSGLKTAEVGLLIADEYQGKGLGTGLTGRIVRAANLDGISMLEAIVDWGNTRMIELVRNLGFPTSEKVEPDLVRIRFPTSTDPGTLAEFQDKWVFRVD